MAKKAEGSSMVLEDSASLQRTLWIRLLISCLCMFFSHLSYYPLAGVYTSLNAEIGFVAFGTLWLTWALGSILLAPPLISILGPRLPVFFGTCLYLLFVVLNYYQSWATLVIAGAAEGIGVSLVWTGLLCSATSSATSLAQVRKASVEKYISMANGLISLSYCASALVGSAISSAILLPSQMSPNLQAPVRGNHSLTDAADSRMLLQNQELSILVDVNLTGIPINSSSCLESSDAFIVPPWSYYTLLTAAFVGTLISVVLSLGTEDMPKAMCSGCKHRDTKSTPKSKKSFLKQFHNLFSDHYNPIFKSLTRPKYLLAMGVSYLGGISQGYIFGTFSRHFISECLGVGVVGLAVIAWAFSSSLISLMIGKVSPYISRSLVAILTVLLQAGMVLFMLFWQREPSYVMVFLISLGWGVADGVWLTLPAIYIGIVAEIAESKAAFGLVKGFFALGGTTSFFASGYISIDANLWSILVVLIVSSVLYIIGETAFTTTSRPVKWLKNYICCNLSETSIYVTDEYKTKTSVSLRAVNPLALYAEDHQEFAEELSIQDGAFVIDDQ